MHLRDYTPDDAGPTLEVFLRAVRITAARDYTPAQIAVWAPDDIDLAAWAARRSAARTRVAVADDGSVVGFGDVGDSGYVDMMFVDPGAAGQGVATALLGWAEETARAAGAMELTTHASVTARPFFQRRGFVVEAEQHPVRRGLELTNYRMRRPLRS